MDLDCFAVYMLNDEIAFINIFCFNINVEVKQVQSTSRGQMQPLFFLDSKFTIKPNNTLHQVHNAPWTQTTMNIPWTSRCNKWQRGAMGDKRTNGEMQVHEIMRDEGEKRDVSEVHERDESEIMRDEGGCEKDESETLR